MGLEGFDLKKIDFESIDLSEFEAGCAEPIKMVALMARAVLEHCDINQMADLQEVLRAMAEEVGEELEALDDLEQAA